MNRFKRAVRWYVSDFTIGFWVAYTYGKLGLTWKMAVIALGGIVVGGFIQAAVEE